MTFPTFCFSADEHLAAAPLPKSLDDAHELFTTHGSVLLKNVFAAPFMEKLREFYNSRFQSELLETEKDDRRPLFSPRISGPLAAPYFYRHPLLFPLVQRLLGIDCVLGACGSVVSFPGSPQQFVHRDSSSLYGNLNLDVRLPVYALTILIPLIDANEATGSTRVWLRSHREPADDVALSMASESPDVLCGNVLVTDSRTFHAGSPNQSNRIRPILYNAYHRRWFRDRGGYEHRPAINIGETTLLRMSRDDRQLFRIASESSFTERAEWRLRKAAARLVPAARLRSLKKFFLRADS